MLDPAINAYTLEVAAASGLVAALMHVATVFTSAHPRPASQLAGESALTFAVGAGVAAALDHAPGRYDVTTVLVIAAVAGSVLGPRGLRWGGSLLVLLLQAYLSATRPGAKVPELPPDELAPTAAPEPPSPPPTGGPPRA